MTTTARCPFCGTSQSIKSGVFVAHAPAKGYGLGRRINHCPGFRRPATGYHAEVSSGDSAWHVEVLQETGSLASKVQDVAFASKTEAAAYAGRFQ